VNNLLPKPIKPLVPQNIAQRPEDSVGRTVLRVGLPSIPDEAPQESIRAAESGRRSVQLPWPFPGTPAAPEAVLSPPEAISVPQLVRVSRTVQHTPPLVPVSVAAQPTPPLVPISIESPASPQLIPVSRERPAASVMQSQVLEQPVLIPIVKDVELEAFKFPTSLGNFVVGSEPAPSAVPVVNSAVPVSNEMYLILGINEEEDLINLHAVYPLDKVMQAEGSNLAGKLNNLCENAFRSMDTEPMVHHRRNGARTTETLDPYHISQHYPSDVLAVINIEHSGVDGSYTCYKFLAVKFENNDLGRFTKLNIF
jgi:hypothetical protein